MSCADSRPDLGKEVKKESSFAGGGGHRSLFTLSAFIAIATVVVGENEKGKQFIHRSQEGEREGGMRDFCAVTAAVISPVISAPQPLSMATKRREAGEIKALVQGRKR